jgi:PAS domain S-box-containing protein
MSVTSRRNRPARLAPQQRNGGTLLETNERLKMLQQVTAAVYSTLELEEVFQRITDAAVSSLGYTSAFIMGLDDKNERFEIKALSATKQLLPQIKKTLGFLTNTASVPANPELNNALRSLGEGRIVIVKTLVEIAYPVISKEACSTLQKLGGAKNYIVIPLQYKGGLVGALFVSSPREEVPEEELTMLQNFAWPASQAIRNAHLYTKAKQAEKTLQESEERFRIAATSVSDLVSDWDILQGKLDWFGNIDEMLGYVSGEFPRTIEAWEKAIHPDDHDRVMAALEQHLNTGTPYIEEYRMIRKDGSLRYWIDRGAAMRDEKGNAYRMIGSCSDTTERKQAEEARQESEARYRALVDLEGQVGEAIVMLQDEEQREGVQIFCNDAWPQITGYSKKELRNMSSAELVHPKDRDAFLARHRRRVGGESIPELFEMTVIRKDGTEVPVEVTGAYTTYLGKRATVAYIRDITERKRAEQKQQAIIKTALDGFWLINLEGKFLEVNDSYCKMIGYTREELLGMSIPDIEAAETPEETVQRIKKIMEQGSDRFETRHKRKDGNIIDVEVSVNYLDVGEGQMFVFVRDITERRKAEEALKLQKAYFQQLFDNSPDAIVMVDNTDRVVQANKGFETLFGYRAEEAKGQFINELIIPEDRIEEASVLSRVALNGKAVRKETVRKRKDGSLVDVSAVGYPIHFGDKLVGVYVIYSDISERKQAEEALKESKEKYSTLIERSTDGILIIRDGLVEFANSRLIEMASYSLDEVLGKPFLEFVAPEYTDMVLDRYAKRIAGEKVPNNYEIEILAKDGRKIPVDMNASRIEYKGGFADMVIIRDITERKQAEEALKESRRRFRDMVNLLPQSVWESDTEGYVTFLNRQGILSFGYGLDEVKEPFNVALAYVPEDRDRMKENTQRVLNGEKLGGTEYTALRKDGSTFPVIVYAVPIIQGNKAVGLRGVTIDITERKQAEELYSTLASSSPVGVYIVQGRKFVFTNPAFRRSMGYTADELLGMDPSTVIRPDDRESVRQSAVQMVKGERFQPYEFRYITKSGETKWALDRVTSITYQGKQATLGNFMDITESKQAQERIEHAAEEWRTTFDSITDFISIHDKDNRLVRMNKALADAFKTTPKELLGKVCHEVMHGTKEPPANCPYRQTLTTGKPATMEMFEPSLGIWLQESTSPIFDAKGEVTGSVHIARDVTRQKRMEEQLIMTDRLASIGELASGIAHELNNPLTSVIGFSQLLMEGNVPDNIKEDLGTVYSEAQRAAAIVKNLLTFARKHASVKQLSQVNAIIEDVLRLRAYEQKVNNIEVDQRLGTNLPEIMVDNFQMQQVFLNIIVNAEFAMLEARGKGKLVITTERVNGVIKVTFTDDGPGIAKENMKRIFAPFFTTKEVGKGTGLGLSICHGIVSGHGGRIYAESELGQGATFVVELPLNGN